MASLERFATCRSQSDIVPMTDGIAMMEMQRRLLEPDELAGGRTYP
jgi:hypothetical protein